MSLYPTPFLNNTNTTQTAHYLNGSLPPLSPRLCPCGATNARRHYGPSRQG